MVQERQNLLGQFKHLCATSHTLSSLPAKKMQRLLTALDKTYSRPASQIPRLPLFDPLLLLARLHMDRADFPTGLDALAQALHALGFVTAGLDRCASTPFQIVAWGHLLDHVVEAFLRARGAFGVWGLSAKAAQADGFARVAYRMLVGEDASFEKTYDLWG